MNFPSAQNFIDLTHSFSPNIPCWDNDCCFTLHTEVDYKDCMPPNLFRVQNVEMKAGAGTHIDAPAHSIPGGTTIDRLALENLCVDCVVIRVDDDAHDDENYLVMPEAVTVFEKEHGMIQMNTFVIFYTGWDQYWNDPKKYCNDLQFPSVHENTARLLIERNIAGLGIDTLSPDARGEDFPVHRVILGAGKYIVENIANAKNIPPTGAKISIMPMKIKEGTEAPVRLVVYLL